MPRAHLNTVKICSALREACFKESYSWQRFMKDTVAGVTVGIIAIPLAMALAIASGVAPQYGLYTAIFGGFVIALMGGSRFSISGPTAAFVVILLPVATEFGLGGLLVATLMAGILLIGMALARLGRMIEYIPGSVTLGFTAGIAVVIATLQINDFLGLHLSDLPENYIERVLNLIGAMPHFDWPTLLVGASTLGVLMIWPKFGIPFPQHLPAVLIGLGVAWWLQSAGYPIDTIGSRFSYTLPSGEVGQGIPAIFPSFQWPWDMPGPTGKVLDWSWDTLRALLPAAFSIAVLGAIESLLCAVVLDGMSGRRHHANSELLGLGIGNLIVPFFGGIPATAAIARSATNFRAKAQSPVSGMLHALFVLLGVLYLTHFLAMLPMAVMAALLLMVSWNIAEVDKVRHLLKRAPLGDILIFILCFSLTVLFDMVIAISVGMVLAAFLFMREIARLTRVIEITDNPKYMKSVLPPEWAVYRINGPLFFAAADNVFAELAHICENKQGIILYFAEVSFMDAGGIAALQRFIDRCQRVQTRLIIAEVQFQPLKTLAKAKIQAVPGEFTFSAALNEACEQIRGEEPVIKKNEAVVQSA